VGVVAAEFAFGLGAPEVVGVGAWREGYLGAFASGTQAADQAVAVEHRADGALGGDRQLAGQATEEEIADLAGPQCGFLRPGPMIALVL
jgi:hypothetical protein